MFEFAGAKRVKNGDGSCERGKQSVEESSGANHERLLQSPNQIRNHNPSSQQQYYQRQGD